jgi:hypothetical protein
MSVPHDPDRPAHELLKALDVAIARGISDAKAGRLKPASDIFDRLEAKYRAMAITPSSKESSSVAIEGETFNS